MVLAGLRYLATADPTTLAAQAQAECLQGLEQAAAIATAARARILAAFTAAQGCSAGADYSPTSWLIHRTGITKGAARGHVGWARRAATHPQVLDALAEGTVLSDSMAATICGWNGRLPAGCRETADVILIAAARAGADKHDLAALAAEIYARSREQRYHDALEDAMRRLVAAGLLPERAGQPVRIWGHISLAELRALAGGSALASEWIGEMAVRWAAHRAAASQTGSDGAAWLDGTPARAMACDASVIPVVTGGIDPGALDELVSLCLQFAGHSPHCAATPGADPHDQTPEDLPGDSDATALPGLRPPTGQGLEMLRHAIIGTAVDLVSGPGGLASFLRTRLLDARLAGPSLPLDVGHSADIPAAIRRAVILRDQHCRWAGGCDQPAAACEVHHVTHLADGGVTSVDGCALYCFFHHHVAIHQWGWTVTLHPDGTTTARSPDGTKTLHSHRPNPPPTARPG